MFCSGCGHALEPGQAVCSQCGRTTAPAAPAPPAVPNMAFEVANFGNRVRALSTLWFIYGGLVILHGLVGLPFAEAVLNNNLIPWMHGPLAHGDFPFGPGFGSAIVHYLWIMTIFRAALAFIAGWGLLERAPWGRVVAIVAAFLSILRIPLGTALAIWTLMTLLGYRNTTLYDEL